MISTLSIIVPTAPLFGAAVVDGAFVVVAGAAVVVGVCVVVAGAAVVVATDLGIVAPAVAAAVVMWKTYEEGRPP